MEALQLMGQDAGFSVLDRDGFSSSLQRELGALEPIQTNPYCAILRSSLGGDPIILKQYRPEHILLAADEKSALDSWAAACVSSSGIYGTGCLASHLGQGVLAIRFVPGHRLSDTLRRVARRPSGGGPLLDQCSQLGSALAQWRQGTTLEAEAGFHPHYRDYARYLARRLSELPVGVGRSFRPLLDQVESRVRQLETCGDRPSRTHGDLVPRNIHVDGGGIGLVDLANSLPNGHPYDDLSNFRLALMAMGLPRSFSAGVWEALSAPILQSGLSEGAENFFREYHRQRWLMLRLITRSPKAWLDAARGLLNFARYQPGQL